MKRRINWALFLLSVVGLISACVLTLTITVQHTMQQAEQSVRELTNSYSVIYQHVNLTDYSDFLQKLPESTRATLITSDGTVIFDSDAAASEMENHLDRPEIQKAIQFGAGEETRRSSTMNAATYYYAVKLADGNILRMARRHSTIRSMVFSAMPGIILIMIILFIIAFLLSRRISKWMIRPVEEAIESLEYDVTDKAVYDELTPFFSRIENQNRKINDQKEILKQERDMLGVITNNMREGLLLISSDRTIISINPSAIEMLSGRKADPYDFIEHNYLIVNRTEEMHDCVDAALEGKSTDAVFSLYGKIFHVYASPMIRLGEVHGVIVIALDETQQRIAERSRQEFSANVSHELKTPLTSISGYAELIENGMVANMDDAKSFCGRIHKEALRLLALIEDIIRLSRIEEAPKHTPQMEEVDLNALCEAIVQSLEPIAKKAQVTVHLQDGTGEILGEDAMLSEMVYNLCENAIKYNRKGGEVWISLTDCGNEIELKIKDTGIGIPEEAQARVFERFYRVDKSRSKQIGGTGLGLSIVKHVVEYHHGRMELESILDMGTEIRVYLPK